MSKQKKVIYILIPEIGKAPFRGRIFAQQKRAVTGDGQAQEGERTEVLTPDGFGVYSWLADHPKSKVFTAAMEFFKERKNKGREVPFIDGPFDCRDEAMKAMQEKRQKAPEELVAVLEADNATKVEELAERDAIIEELKKKITDATKGNK